MNTVTILLIIANVLISWKGLRDPLFYNRFCFQVEKILVQKQYYRFFSSGFLHNGWWHLIWNMIVMFAFSGIVETFLGTGIFLLIYFVSMLGGKLFALFVHRHHEDYASAGASGAVNGILFAAIALVPTATIGLFLVPLPIPAWVFGLIYMVVTIYGVRSGQGNTGHESHLGGSLIGIFLALLFYPSAFEANWMYILILTVPALVFTIISVARPHMLVIGQGGKNRKKYYGVDHRYNAEKVDKQKELDRILEKISRKGMSSLTAKEKQMLKEYSKTLR